MCMANPYSATLTVTLLAGLACTGMGTGPATPTADPFAYLSSTITLNATIRDFKYATQPGGHPDFESYGNSNITTELVQETLGADGLPEFRGRTGKFISRNFTDGAGRAINPKHMGLAKVVRVEPPVGSPPNTPPTYSTVAASDTAGVLTTTSNQLTSAERFAQWYTDVPGVNLSKIIPLVFQRTPNTNRYVFDSATQEPWKSAGGFFPINGDLFGNSSGSRNFGFTTQIETVFTYEKGKGQVFTFSGDDDVWVFIGGRLVLDLGGLHPRQQQTVEIDRLDASITGGFLHDGVEYSLKVFHAERHTSESNFRIETTIVLKRAELPQANALFD